MISNIVWVPNVDVFTHWHTLYLKAVHIAMKWFQNNPVWQWYVRNQLLAISRALCKIKQNVKYSYPIGTVIMYPLNITWFLSVITPVRHILNFGPALVGCLRSQDIPITIWKSRDWIGCGSSWVPTQSKITRHSMWGAFYLKYRRYPTSSFSTDHCSLCSLKMHQTLLIFCVYGTCHDVINSCDPHRPLYRSAPLRGSVWCYFFQWILFYWFLFESSRMSMNISRSDIISQHGKILIYTRGFVAFSCKCPTSSFNKNR